MAFGPRQGFKIGLSAASCLAAWLLVAPLLAAGSALADNENAAWLMLKKKKATASTSDDPGHSSNNWSNAGASGKAVTTTRIVNDGSVSPFLMPESSTAIQAAETRYAAIVASGGWNAVPSGKYKKGGKNKGVAALNRRLFIEGYLREEATQGEYADLYTSATEEAVSRFQRNNGLAVTGTLDNATLKALNVSAQKRLAAIRANLPRIAEYSKDLGDRYVVVNVPAMQIEAINNGTVYSVHNAIVGRPSRPTPVVATHLATIRFNPYWNAPPSIVEKDILPRMLSSRPSKVMNDMNMKVFDGIGGPEVNPDKINWRRVVVDDYHFRQEPGGSNAMATAKIEFNSPFGIYLHDTPEPELFLSGQRFYSSGCVRVEKVAILLDWILNGQDGIDSGRIASLAESKERLDVKLAAGPQLRVVYLTAWPGANGEMNFRPDIYELDSSGFVTGQPLPVGESMNGQRFVLKPVPRSQAAVDADEAGSFFNIFNTTRNSDKHSSDDVVRASAAASSDNLLKLKPKQARTAKAAKSAGKTKAKAKSATQAQTAWSFGGDDSGADALMTDAVTGNASSKATGAKSKKKSATGKTDAKTKKKVVSAKKKAAKPGASAKTGDAATSKKTEPAKKATPAKSGDPAQCKAAKDGKLPAGCKAPTVASKAKVKPVAAADTAAN